MDKIWDRKLAVVAGMKKPNDHAEPTKRRTLKKQNNFTFIHKFYTSVYLNYIYS